MGQVENTEAFGKQARQSRRPQDADYRDREERANCTDSAVFKGGARGQRRLVRAHRRVELLAAPPSSVAPLPFALGAWHRKQARTPDSLAECVEMACALFP